MMKFKLVCVTRTPENEEKQRIIMQHDVLYSYDDIKGRSSLAWAVLQGNIGVAKALISAGAEIDAKEYDSSTPLHMQTMSFWKNVAAPECS